MAQSKVREFWILTGEPTSRLQPNVIWWITHYKHIINLVYVMIFHLVNGFMPPPLLRGRCSRPAPCRVRIRGTHGRPVRARRAWSWGAQLGPEEKWQLGIWVSCWKWQFIVDFAVNKNVFSIVILWFHQRWLVWKSSRNGGLIIGKSLIKGSFSSTLRLITGG